MGLPQATPLHFQVNEGAETGWQGGRTTEGMSGSEQCVYPCGRPGLSRVISPATHQCAQELGLEGLPGKARPQYSPTYQDRGWLCRAGP